MKVTLENLNSAAVRRVEFYYNRADQFGETGKSWESLMGNPSEG